MYNQEKVITEVTRISGDAKRISCSQAFKCAAENDISAKEIGLICNRLGIKIVSCQLGCFK